MPYDAQTLLTEVQVQNTDGKLFAGMFCNVQFHLVNPAPPLKIPIGALISDSQGNQVAVVDSENVAHYRTVTLGANTFSWRKPPRETRPLLTQQIQQALTGLEKIRVQ